ncbi:hypothetical protein Tco_0405751 [Tanacetum coccineum]
MIDSIGGLGFLDLVEKILDDELGYNHGGYPEMNILTIDLIGDEEPTDEDGDIGVSVSLGDEIFSKELGKMFPDEAEK